MRKHMPSQCGTTFIRFRANVTIKYNVAIRMMSFAVCDQRAFLRKFGHTLCAFMRQITGMRTNVNFQKCLSTKPFAAYLAEMRFTGVQSQMSF